MPLLDPDIKCILYSQITDIATVVKVLRTSRQDAAIIRRCLKDIYTGQISGAALSLFPNVEVCLATIRLDDISDIYLVAGMRKLNMANFRVVSNIMNFETMVGNLMDTMANGKILVDNKLKMLRKDFSQFDFYLEDLTDNRHAIQFGYGQLNISGPLSPDIYKILYGYNGYLKTIFILPHTDEDLTIICDEGIYLYSSPQYYIETVSAEGTDFLATQVLNLKIWASLESAFGVPIEVYLSEDGDHPLLEFISPADVQSVYHSRISLDHLRVLGGFYQGTDLHAIKDMLQDWTELNRVILYMANPIKSDDDRIVIYPVQDLILDLNSKFRGLNN